MHVFVTGASGFIAGATIPRLLAKGHTVSALVRSDVGETKVKAFGAGVTPVRGTLNDLETLAREAKAADAIIHLGFIHDFTNYMASIEVDKVAITAMLEAIKGTNKTFLGTSGTLSVAGNHPGTEDMPGAGPRAAAEVLVQSYAAQGVRTCIVRLAPTCHGEGDHGFIAFLRDGARRVGQATYIGDGNNHWPACHRDDVGELYVLALEKGEPGAIYHAAAEDGVTVKEIVTAIGNALSLPVVSVDKPSPDLGFIGMVLGMDGVVSSEKTRKQLGWQPKGVTLLEDLAQGHYFASSA